MRWLWEILGIVLIILLTFVITLAIASKEIMKDEK